MKTMNEQDMLHFVQRGMFWCEIPRNLVYCRFRSAVNTRRFDSLISQQELIVSLCARTITWVVPRLKSSQFLGRFFCCKNSEWNGVILMKLYTSHEIRTKFIRFFQAKGHEVISSASVIPDNDPKVLFTTARE